MTKLNLRIVAVDGSRYDGEADSVVVAGINGEFEVLVNHSPIISTLAIGSVKVNNGSSSTVFAIDGGTIEVFNNQVTIITHSAESSDHINKLRAEKAKARALAHLNNATDDHKRAHLAMARAENRLKILLLNR